MKVIGLCGSSGAGKSTVGALFSEFKFAHVDTDAVYHSLISCATECTAELAASFGSRILNENGGVHRPALAEIVFADKDKLLSLNKIAHKHVLCEVRRIISEIGEDSSIHGVIVDAPLLFESGFDKECDAIIAVTADRKVKIERIMKRDNITYSQAEKRLDNQASDEDIISRATYVIINNDLDELRGAVKDIANKIINLK